MLWSYKQMIRKTFINFFLLINFILSQAFGVISIKLFFIVENNLFIILTLEIYKFLYRNLNILNKYNKI